FPGRVTGRRSTRPRGNRAKAYGRRGRSAVNASGRVVLSVAVAGGHWRRLEVFALHEVLVGLAALDDFAVAVLDQHHGGSRVHVVGAGHGDAVGARGGNSD